MSTRLEAALPGVTAPPPDIQADLDEVRRCWKEGIPVDRAIAARIRTYSRALMQATYERHGVLDIGVPAIRELRGELPE